MPAAGAINYRLNRILGANFVLSVVCLVVAHQRFAWMSDTVNELIKEAGFAFLIAVILGVSVDQALKTEVVRDVFTAAFQYALDPALKGEILRIMRYQQICERHLFQVSLEVIDGEAVRVNCYVERVIKNIGSSDQQVRPWLHIYEWGFPQGGSQVTECSIEIGNQIVEARETQVSPDTVLFQGEERSLKPKRTCTTRYRWSEVRRHNDTVDMQFATPTINPVIEISPAQGFKFTANFGSASRDIEELVPGRHALTGTYMPYHHMVVRWYPVGDAAMQDGDGDAQA
jgi:hypothetical protein